MFNAADAEKWSNILVLIELLFCLHATNGQVERVFSTLKVIKTDRRNQLSENSLDDLVCIAVEMDLYLHSGMQNWLLSSGGDANQGDGTQEHHQHLVLV